MNKHAMLGMLAETSIHVGAGQMMGAIDLPVAREAATQYPVIPGSSLKGTLRERVERSSPEEANRYFGYEGSAAGIGVSDGRLLLLPIRSFSGVYRWVTCPSILERFARDCQFIGQPFDFTPILVPEEQAWVMTDEPHLILEELTFHSINQRDHLTKYIEAIRPLIAHSFVQQRLPERFTVISDADFSILTQIGLFVYARNVLDHETKQSKNLWYEESLPADTLFYTLLLSRNGTQDLLLSQFQQQLTVQPYIQVGGNETTGQGWMIVTHGEGEQ